MTTREFFQHPKNVKNLRPGQSLGVTDNGVSSFTVTKSGQRPRRTLAELKRRAQMICPEASPKVNFTQAIRELKGR